MNSKAKQPIGKVTLETYKMGSPKETLDSGLRHKAQAGLLSKVQQYVVDAQAVMMTHETELCENCRIQLKKIGDKKSDFYTVFSDHKLKAQGRICPKCNNRHLLSIKSLFVTSINKWKNVEKSYEQFK